MTLGRILALVVVVGFLYFFVSHYSQTPSSGSPPGSLSNITSGRSPITDKTPLGKDRLTAGDGEIVWTDPAGDVEPYVNSPRPRPDVVSVKAGSADGYLVLTAQFMNDLSVVTDWMDEKNCRHGGNLVEYFIDSDNDPATGGAPNWAQEADRPLKGYEARFDVLWGYLVREKGSTGEFNGWTGGMVFDPEQYDIDQACISASAWPMSEALKDAFAGESQAWRDRVREMCVLERDTCQVRIPYALLNVSAGNTLRLCFKESAQGAASGKGFSEDRLLVLR